MKHWFFSSKSLLKIYHYFFSQLLLKVRLKVLLVVHEINLRIKGFVVKI